ncbi:unnamed protein product, partial [Ectocarpus fasciculatus]
MSHFGRVLKAAAAVMVLVTAAVMVLEILELSQGGSGGGRSGGGGGGARHADGTGREDIMINPAILLPNEWRVKTEGGAGVGELSDDIGTRSVHNGAHQRKRQLWLETRAKDIREGRAGTGSSNSVDEKSGSNTIGGGAQGQDPQSSAATARAAEGGGGGHVEKEEGTAGATQIRTAGEARSSASAAVDRIIKGDETATGGGGETVNETVNDARGSRRRRRARSSSSGPSRSLRRGRGGGGDVHRENVAPEGGGFGRRGGQGEEKKTVEGGKGGRGFRALGDEPPPEQGGMWDGEVAAVDPLPLEERLGRLETGVELWGATYVPPIAPEEMRRLTDKWTAPGATSGAAAAAAARGDNNQTNNSSTTAT